MHSGTFLVKIQFWTTFILGFFPCDAYFRQSSWLFENFRMDYIYDKSECFCLLPGVTSQPAFYYCFHTKHREGMSIIQYGQRVYSYCCGHFMRQISRVSRFEPFHTWSGKIMKSKCFFREKIFKELVHSIHGRRREHVVFLTSVHHRDQPEGDLVRFWTKIIFDYDVPLFEGIAFWVRVIHFFLILKKLWIFKIIFLKIVPTRA